MGLISALYGMEYDELIEILASDDDGEMTFAELQDITGWDQPKIIKMLKKLIHYKSITGRVHMGQQKVFFNSVDTTPFKNKKSAYGQGGLVRAYTELFMDTGKGGKNKKITTVMQCPKCKATKQVIKGNVTKCDYCDTPMETKNF